MTVLTWRDVAAPDFRGVSDGFESASRMLQQALAAGKGGIDDIQAARAKIANNEIMAELLKYQDPAQLEQALSTNGAIQSRINPRLVSAETMQTLASRPTELLALASDKVKFGEQQKLIADHDHFRKNRPIFNAFADARRSGNLELANQIQAANADIFKNANTALLDDLISGSQDVYRDDLSGMQSLFNYKKDGVTFQHTLEDRTTGLLLESIKSRVSSSGLPEDYLGYAIANRETLIKDFAGPDGANSEIAARAVDRLINQLAGQQFGSGSGSSSVSGGGLGSVGGGVTSGDPTRIMNPEARASGFAAVPDSVKTLGQASDFALQVNAANRRRMGTPGSSAMGTYQIVGDTLRRYAPKVFGDGWQSVSFDQDAQDKLAKAIFEDHNGSAAALRKQWTSLNKFSDSEVERIRKMPWSEARVVIAAGESGAQADFFNGRREGKAFTDTAITHQYATDPLTPLEVGFKENVNNTSTAKQMALGLIATGEFKDEDPDYLADVIDNVAKKYDLSPALAAVAVRHSADGKDGFFRRPFSRLFGDGLKVYIDGNQLEKNAKALQDRPGMARKIARTTTQTDALASSSQAEANLQQATAALNAKRQRLRQARIPETEANLGTELLAVAEAQAAYEAAQSRSEQTMVAGERPAPPVSSAKAPPRRTEPQKSPVTQASAPKGRTIPVNDAMLKRAMGAMLDPRQNAAFIQEFGVTPANYLDRVEAMREKARQTKGREARQTLDRILERAAKSPPAAVVRRTTASGISEFMED